MDMEKNESVFTEQDKKAIMDYLKEIANDAYTIKAWVNFWSILSIIAAVVFLFILVMK